MSFPAILAQTETPVEAPAETPAPPQLETTQTQSTPPPPTPQSGPPSWTQFIPLILIVVIFYFFVIRSKRTQDKKRNAMLSLLKKGDRVQTIGGILGTVIEARETEVLVKVDESSNTKIRFARSAIHRVVEDDKAEVK
jgi:preprotein translocase subunit YajC